MSLSAFRSALAASTLLGVVCAAPAFAQHERLATLGPEQYMGRDQELGSIARGKIADFILLPGDPAKDLSELHRISMVVKDGTIYFPSEIYPAFGVKPFAAAPKMTLPATAPKLAGSGPAHDAMDEFLY